jgi:hypothetical protein
MVESFTNLRKRISRKAREVRKGKKDQRDATEFNNIKRNTELKVKKMYDTEND